MQWSVLSSYNQTIVDSHFSEGINYTAYLLGSNRTVIRLDLYAINWLLGAIPKWNVPR